MLSNLGVLEIMKYLIQKLFVSPKELYYQFGFFVFKKKNLNLELYFKYLLSLILIFIVAETHYMKINKF